MLFSQWEKNCIFYTAWKNLTLKGAKVDKIKQVYNQQIAPINLSTPNANYSWRCSIVKKKKW